MEPVHNNMPQSDKQIMMLNPLSILLLKSARPTLLRGRLPKAEPPLQLIQCTIVFFIVVVNLIGSEGSNIGWFPSLFFREKVLRRWLLLHPLSGTIFVTKR